MQGIGIGIGIAGGLSGGGHRGPSGPAPHSDAPSGCPGGTCPSDIRLKHDIALLGRTDNGLGLYRYRYNWSEQLYVGVMAQEVEKIVPAAVTQGPDGFKRVNYESIGLKLMTWGDWLESEAGRSHRSH
jgi:hypothetical protein